MSTLFLHWTTRLFIFSRISSVPFDLIAWLLGHSPSVPSPQVRGFPISGKLKIVKSYPVILKVICHLLEGLAKGPVVFDQIHLFLKSARNGKWSTPRGKLLKNEKILQTLQQNKSGKWQRCNDKITRNHEFWQRLFRRSSQYEQQQQKRNSFGSYLGRLVGNFLKPNGTSNSGVVML